MKQMQSSGSLIGTCHASSLKKLAEIAEVERITPVE